MYVSIKLLKSFLILNIINLSIDLSPFVGDT